MPSSLDLELSSRSDSVAWNAACLFLDERAQYLTSDSAQKKAVSSWRAFLALASPDALAGALSEYGWLHSIPSVLKPCTNFLSRAETLCPELFLPDEPLFDARKTFESLLDRSLALLDAEDFHFVRASSSIREPDVPVHLPASEALLLYVLSSFSRGSLNGYAASLPMLGPSLIERAMLLALGSPDKLRVVDEYCDVFEYQAVRTLSHPLVAPRFVDDPSFRETCFEFIQRFSASPADAQSCLSAVCREVSFSVDAPRALGFLSTLPPDHTRAYLSHLIDNARLLELASHLPLLDELCSSPDFSDIRAFVVPRLLHACLSVGAVVVGDGVVEGRRIRADVRRMDPDACFAFELETASEDVDTRRLEKSGVPSQFGPLASAIISRQVVCSEDADLFFEVVGPPSEEDALVSRALSALMLNDRLFERFEEFAPTARLVERFPLLIGALLSWDERRVVALSAAHPFEDYEHGDPDLRAYRIAQTLVDAGARTRVKPKEGAGPLIQSLSEAICLSSVSKTKRASDAEISSPKRRI